MNILSTAQADYNRRYFGGRLPLIPAYFAELAPDVAGEYYAWENPRILINSLLVDRPKLVKLALLHEQIHQQVYTFHPPENRVGGHYGTGWRAEVQRICWIRGISFSSVRNLALFPFLEKNVRPFALSTLLEGVS